MGRQEKAFCIFYSVYVAVYVPVFIAAAMTHRFDFKMMLPFHLLGMVLGFVFIIVVVRDIYRREFPSPNQKITWTILVLMFWPSVFLYLLKYGFKPRHRKENGQG